ncbi:hypothetical protein SCHPADRAFT_995013 [Schizopora paradoxa]|uniref:Uncharacterized protein n=1 Tax=Schizopora paradoxa TaxID=27342 RepID=A0A0H2SHP1_9AGAM|nr:hypothetical protein SCHPADRAFT_995013 [Schizopora paradoxa]
MFSKSSIVFALSVLAALSEVHVALAAPALSCIADTTSVAAAATTSSAIVAVVSTSAAGKAATTSVAKSKSTSVAKAASSSVAKAKSTSVAKAATTSVAKGKTTSVAKAASTSVAKAASTSVAKGKGASTSVATAVSTSAAASSTNVLSNTGGSTGSSSGNATANNSNAQDSLTLDPRVIATGFEQDGQETPTAGQIASATSNNNFINFCLTVPNLPITNGQQITTGSCNPAPMGVIAGQQNMPQAKFTSPTNFGTVPANTNFTVTLAINNFQAGAFVNAESNYFAAPQTVNAQGNIIGHSHIVIEAIDSLGSTTPLDNTKFTFFKGLNDPFSNGNQLSAVVAGGVPAGTYRIASINTAANHQPVLVAVAQHGSVDDMIYITATDGGAASGSAASTTAAAAASSAAAKGNTGNNNNQKGNTGKNTPAKGKGNQNNFRPGGRF